MTVSSHIEPGLGRGRLLGLQAPLRLPVLLAIAYYLGAEAAFYIGTLSDRIFAPFWPPNVILFCALLLVPERRWWLLIAACFPAHVVAELRVGMPAIPLLVAFATNCLVAVLNAMAVRRLLGDPPRIGDLRRVAIYVFISAGLSPAVSAFGGAFVPILLAGPIENYWLFWTQWYFANVLPHLTLGPLFLTWLSASPNSSAVASPYRKLEAAVLAILLVAVCAVAFQVTPGSIQRGFLPAVLYSPLPLVLWAALRFGEGGASGATLLVSVVLIWRTLKGPSLFVDADPETNMLALQIFLAALSIPVLLLGAAINELRNAAQATRQLAGAVLTARDEERRRIARDLHDSTGQNLIAAKLLVDRIRRGAASEGTTAIAQQLDQTLQQSIDEVRTISYLLHPPLLDDMGLELALRSYVDGYAQRSGLVIALEVYPDLGRLAPEIELAFFRVVQEALSNVSRHSGSRTARIRLERGTDKEGKGLILTVEDDGCGIGRSLVSTASARQSKSSLGLASMRERLHQIGGRFHLDSRAGRTVITAVVPERDAGAPTNT